MNRIPALLLLGFALTTLAGCAGSSGSDPVAPLSASNINLIFVVSPDLAFQAPGDVNPDTANLTSQGLQRSLSMATYLRQQVLGSRNVTAIYALEPMTHLQTADNYPDMAALGYIEQLAILNQFTELSTTAYSYPISTSYTQGALPDGVVPPNPYTPTCRGLDFDNTGGDNDSLVTGIISANAPGFYVFSAPWETIGTLMADINRIEGYGLSIPTAYIGADYVYAISITTSGVASLVTYNANLSPTSAYPVLPASVQPASCNIQQPYFSLTNQGVGGSSIPNNINKNETVYLVRHAEAHPGLFDDGNYVGAGQWRALYLASALRGKISPTLVYSVDPAQGSVITSSLQFSYVRPSLTVLPYAIANSMPLNLAAGVSVVGPATDMGVAGLTSNFFFTGGTFSNQTILVAWEHNHFPPLITALLQSYGINNPAVPSWPTNDYDTIWRVQVDSQGNVTVDNALCEGIDSASLPAAPPQF